MYDTSKPAFDLFSKIHYGRIKIVLDYDYVDESNIREVLDKALIYHSSNKSDCDYLIKYFLGKQDILNRTAPESTNINNKVVVNHAFPITREIVGYTFGNPIEYIQRDVGKKTDVETLSDLYENVGMFQIDTNTAYFASICGIGYQITLPSDEISEEYVPDIPFTVDALDPRDTFCVFSNKIGEPQIMSCTIRHTKNEGDIYTCFTKDNVFTLTNRIDQEVLVEPNPLGMDPITMFENSLFRTGDWEEAIDVMNASNMVASDSLNDIEGTIRSLLVLTGAEFEDDTTGLAKIKQNRLLTLVNPNGNNVDAKFIAPVIDSNSIQNIREYLEDARNLITGIPDRQTASGGDTGTAVLNRNGWTDIEIVAKLKELFFKKSKKRQVAIGLQILKMLGLIAEETSAKDIDITIGRHTTDNLQSKAQAFATLVGTGVLATIDCLEMAGLTNRVNEVVERGEEAKAEREKQAIELAQQTSNKEEGNSTEKEEKPSNEAENSEKQETK